MPSPLDPSYHSCPRCGAITTGTDVPKHDRGHAREDELEERLVALEDGGGNGGLRLERWPGTDEPEAVDHAQQRYGDHL